MDNSNQKLVPAVCPQCGAHLEVDPDKETLYCQYCGSKFLVPDAIKAARITIDNSITQSTHVERVTGLGNKVTVNNKTPVNEYEYLKTVEETKQKKQDNRNNITAVICIIVFLIVMSFLL